MQQTNDVDIAAVSDEAACVHTRDSHSGGMTSTPCGRSLPPTPLRRQLRPPRRFRASLSPSAVSGTKSQLHPREVRGRLLPIGVLDVTQDSIAEHRLTDYYLTQRQWLKRVLQRMATLGDASHVDSWKHRALERRPFEEHDIVGLGRAAALPCRPDAAEPFQRHVASTLERVQRTIHTQLQVVEVGPWGDTTLRRSSR